MNSSAQENTYTEHCCTRTKINNLKIGLNEIERVLKGKEHQNCDITAVYRMGKDFTLQEMLFFPSCEKFK